MQSSAFLVAEGIKGKIRRLQNLPLISHAPIAEDLPTGRIDDEPCTFGFDLGCARSISARNSKAPGCHGPTDLLLRKGGQV
jgi:hypothetical protein